MLYHLNEIAALIAVPTLVLSFRGFWPHMVRMLRHRHEYPPQIIAMVLMILIVDVKGIARMAYWDLWRSFMHGSVGSLHGTLVNASLDMASFLSGVAGLAALYYTIPPEDRAGWNWFTAPFYPKPCKIWIWRK